MKKNIKKNLIIFFICILFLVLGSISESYISQYKEEYAKAKNLLKQEKYEEAIKKFEGLEKYKLSKIDLEDINDFIYKAEKKLQLEKYFIDAEKFLYSGKYIDALKYYFKNNDTKTKYYGSSKARIEETLKLYLMDSKKNGTKEDIESNLEGLLSEIENDDNKISILYKEEIDRIRKIIKNIKEKGINSVFPQENFKEEDFFIRKNDLGLYQITHKESGLVQNVDIEGVFSPYADYYTYKIKGNIAGQYELIFNFKGHTHIVKGNLEDVENMLQVYRLPEKPQYGDIMLVNLKIKINDKYIHSNISSKYTIVTK